MKNGVSHQKFKTDGELYDTSLSRDTKEDIFKLYSVILDWLNCFRFVTIFDIVCLISHFPASRNWVYASSHGYSQLDIVNFNVRPTEGREMVHIFGKSERVMIIKRR